MTSILVKKRVQQTTKLSCLSHIPKKKGKYQTQYW